MFGVCRDPDHSLAFNRLTRIHDQVHENLVELASVAQYRWDLIKISFDLAVILDLVGKHLQYRLDAVIDVRFFARQRIGACERFKTEHDFAHSLRTVKGFRNQLLSIGQDEVQIILCPDFANTLVNRSIKPVAVRVLVKHLLIGGEERA